MGKRLYVGNLPYTVDDKELQTIFDAREAVVIIDRDSGGSKGFGFVELETEEAARAAVEKWHDFELHGRRLRVNEAHERESRPRSPRAPRDGGGNGGGLRGRSDAGGAWDGPPGPLLDAAPTEEGGRQQSRKQKRKRRKQQDSGGGDIW